MDATSNNTDYSTLIDQQVQAFIRQTDEAFPADAATLGIDEQRKLYDAMCRKFRVDNPPDIISSDSFIHSHPDTEQVALKVAVRRYCNSDAPSPTHPAQLVYLHGGGFVVGGLDSHDDVCAEICHHTGHDLTSVDYRLSPEHKHPHALNDVMLVVNSLWEEHGQAIVLCGDSAGANLAAATCHAMRNLQTHTNAKPVIRAQVLIYPGLGGDTTQGSYITHAHAPMLSTEDVHFYSHIRCSSKDDLNDPTFAPLIDNDFSSIPPTVVFSAECDPLSDDGREYSEQIQQAGGKAYWANEKGLVHGFLRARHSCDRAEASFHRIVNAISTLADARWPYS